MSEENIEATEPEPEDLDKIANDFVDSLLLSDEENENQLPEEQNNSTATPKNAVIAWEPTKHLQPSSRRSSERP